MRKVVSSLAIAVLFFALGFASAQGAASAPTAVFISSQAPSEQIHGVKELSLVTSKGKMHPCAARLGSSIELLLIDLDVWLNELRSEGRITTKRDKEELAAKVAGKTRTAEELKAEKSRDHGGGLIDEMLPRMVLILDGKAMTTLRAVQASKDAAYIADPTPSAGTQLRNGRWYSVQFQLTRDRDNEDSKAEWKDVLKQSGVELPMDVTLGIVGDDGKTVYGSPTHVLKGAKVPEDRFTFQRVPWDGWTATGIILLLAAFVFFIYLALCTPIIRDPAQPISPDGLPPVSLGRCQMAFWFFLVAGAFFFLWLVTGRGDLDTITDSTLVLLGISAGTALGSAFIQRKDQGGNTPAPVVNYRADIAAAKERLLTLKNDRTRIPQPDNAGLLKANDDDTAKAMAALRESEDNLAAYRRANPHQFLTDLLSEDGKSVTFHRFQIVVWTLVLGVVFVSEVLTRLAMPTFSSTLLLLMGISSGTYIGFKFTPSQPNTTP
jgi:hypothetical protein